MFSYIVLGVCAVLLLAICFLLWQNARSSKGIAQARAELDECNLRIERERGKARLAEIQRAEEMKAEPVETVKKRVLTEPKNYEFNTAEAEAQYALIDEILDGLPTSNGMKKSYKDALIALRGLLSGEVDCDDADQPLFQTEAYKSLAEKVKNAFSEITPVEVKICVLVCMGKTSREIAQVIGREIAQVIGRETRSVESLRNRMRKNLGIDNGIDIKEFVFSKLSS